MTPARTDTEDRLLLCLCACPDSGTAQAIARALVEESLAACVSALPGATSIYRWEGRIEQAEEVLLLIKTRAERLPALIARVRALHPYAVPELIAFEAVGGLPDYLHWVADTTRAPD